MRLIAEPLENHKNKIMAELNQDVKILNAVVSSMETMVGEQANIILNGINGIMIDKKGRIIKVDNLKSAINALINKYESIVGDYASVKIADCLAPYAKKDKKLKSILPKIIRDSMERTPNISRSLSKWNKTRAIKR